MNHFRKNAILSKFINIQLFTFNLLSDEFTCLGWMLSKNTFISILSEVLSGNNNQSENPDNYYPEVSNNSGLTTFHVTAGTPDPEEEAFIRRMKKKRRKRSF